MLVNKDEEDINYKLILNDLEIQYVTSYKYLGFVLNANGNLLEHLEERMKNAQQLQCFILSKITSCKGLTPKNASFLIKATFN